MRKHMNPLLCGAFLLFLCVALPGLAGDEQHEPKSGEIIPWWCLGGGASNASSAGYVVRGTIGQHSVGHAASTSYEDGAGYWLPIASGTCCAGPSRGNVDGSPDNAVSLGDLTVMIDHLFISLDPLTCWEEGNVDESLPEGPGSCTLGDLTVMIDHLFISLDPLPACP